MKVFSRVTHKKIQDFELRNLTFTFILSSEEIKFIKVSFCCFAYNNPRLQGAISFHGRDRDWNFTEIEGQKGKGPVV